MNEEQKKQYLEKYYQEKQKGVKFWPDIIYKDLLVTFAIFLVLMGLAIFIGVPAEPKADPSDAAYIPRPEWYFLWLFEFLKYIPGQLEWVGAVLVPGILVALLFLLPFYDRNPFRHWKKRIFAITSMSVIVIAIVALTIIAQASTPEVEEVAIASSVGEQVALGQELYLLECSECHGPDGDVTQISGVEGLEGAFVSPISSKDVMYTRTDETLFNVIAQGQQDLGMPPFGSAYGGELTPAEVEYIVAFMRFTWDDRVEMPEDAVAASSIPTLAPGEIPNWDQHIQPLFKRYCDSCHRPNKTNNNYITLTYDEALNTGDNAPVMVAGDPNSLLLRLIHREDIPNVAGPMPPSKALPDNLTAMLEAWVLAGMPKTAADAGIGVPAPVEPATATPIVETPVSPDVAPVEPTPTPEPTAEPSATPTANLVDDATATPELPTPEPSATPAPPTNTPAPPTSTPEAPTPYP
jgi:mono/diheme cytochrome c family protein